MSASTQEDFLRKIMGEVTEKLTHDLRDVLAKTLSQTLEEQLSAALTQALLESEVYRRISNDMRSGLQRIYKKISATAEQSVLHETSDASKERTNQLFHEASKQLSEVLTQTEQATVKILDLLDKNLELQAEGESLLSKLNNDTATDMDKVRLSEINVSISSALNDIMMTLSFQDLTGQRIKRAVGALKEIESTVVELYLSTGLLIQAYEESPTRPIEEMAAETKKKVTEFKTTSVLDAELKGPTSDASSQRDIDALLSQLGL